jgi:hypothetical protein
LCELFGFASPRTFQDIVHVQIYTGENLIDLVDSLPFILGTFVRQPLRISFGLVFRKIVLKDFRKVLLKVFLVVIIAVYSRTVPAPQALAFASNSTSSGASARSRRKKLGRTPRLWFRAESGGEPLV